MPKRWMFLGLLCGCGGPALTTAGYDLDCTTADDCIAVQVGSVCSWCCDDFGAIAASEAADYNAQWWDAYGTCPAEVEVCDAACEAPEVDCVQQQCIVR